MLRDHPVDAVLSLGLQYDRVFAEAVVHWFGAERPGEVRGIKDIMPALPLFAQLRRFTLAVRAAADLPAALAELRDF